MVSVAAMQTWLRVQSLLWLPILIWLAASSDAPAPPAAWLAAAIVVSFAALVVLLRGLRTVADFATIGRIAALVAWVALVRVPADPLGWTLAAAITAADLADGALARRLGGTPEGAVLDMEADQFTVLGLSVLLVAGGGGAHALLLPAMRYVFVLAAWWLRVPAHEPKPVAGDNRRGRTVCACVFVALLVALLPGVPPRLADLTTGVAVVLLAWSFAGDARFLWSRRRGARA